MPITYKFPIQRESHLGYVKMTNNKLEAVGNSILMMITTYGFERIDGEVTAQLEDFLFEQISDPLINSIETRIRNKIQTLFPQVLIRNLTIYSKNTLKSLEENQILISLSVSLKENDSDTLTLKLILP